MLKRTPFRYRLPPPLAGLLLISLVLLNTAAAGTGIESTAREAIYANVADALEIEAPVEYFWTDLVIGANVSEPQLIHIKSNRSYSVKLRSVTRMRMGEYDMAEGRFVSGGRALSENLQWLLDGSEAEPLTVSRTDQTVLSGMDRTGDSGSNVGIRFVQHIGYGDERLPEGRMYRIDVIYTVVQDV